MKEKLKEILSGAQSIDVYKGVQAKLTRLDNGSYGYVITELPEITFAYGNRINLLQPKGEPGMSNVSDINFNPDNIRDAVIGMKAYAPIFGGGTIVEVIQDKEDPEFGRVKFRLRRETGEEEVFSQETVNFDV